MSHFGFFFFLKREKYKKSKIVSDSGNGGFFYSFFLREQRVDKFPQIRLIFFILLGTAVFFIFSARLIYLQVFKGESYRKIAEGNKVFTRRLAAARGIITDRFGKQLVLNSPRFILRKGNEIKELSEVQAKKLEVLKNEDSKNIEILGKRKYLMGEEFSHLIGYLGEISAKELKDVKFAAYKMGDKIGRGGVEEMYEKILAGKNGEEFFEVNARGQIVSKLGETTAIPGKNIKLTIDSDLQKIAYDELLRVKENERYYGGDVVKGSVIVSAVYSGEILAMVSVPAFDPSHPEKYVNDQKNYPLMNRSISAVYPPGSTFKLVTAVAGLESGKINKNTLVEDTGVIKIGKWEFPTWSSIRDGMVDVVKGIKRSNDIFFYKAAEMTGLENIVKYSKKFGLGQKIGIDLPAESAGNLPSDEWKFSVAKEHWYLGDTYHLGIGQGYILTTPLQVNMWTNVIASGGKLYRPHVVLTENGEWRTENREQRIENSKILKQKDSDFLNTSDYLIRDLHLKKETLDLIWKGMREACQTGGTGWPLFDFKIPVACKTGTAEHLEGEETHAWFTAFAPADKPEIAVTVLIENGGQGSDVAAPVARKILEKYFGVN